MGSARAFLGVGSNILPERHIPQALDRLAAEVVLAAISTFYRTPALPDPVSWTGARRHDPPFFNGVVEIHTELGASALETLLLRIEREAGRLRTADRYSPRTLDLDILVYLPAAADGAAAGSASAAHADVYTRPWVALPLLELEPALRLPPDGEPLREVARRFAGPGGEALEAFTLELRRRFLGSAPAAG